MCPMSFLWSPQKKVMISVYNMPYMLALLKLEGVKVQREEVCCSGVLDELLAARCVVCGERW